MGPSERLNLRRKGVSRGAWVGGAGGVLANGLVRAPAYFTDKQKSRIAWNSSRPPRPPLVRKKIYKLPIDCLLGKSPRAVPLAL